MQTFGSALALVYTLLVASGMVVSIPLLKSDERGGLAVFFVLAGLMSMSAWWLVIVGHASYVWVAAGTTLLTVAHVVYWLRWEFKQMSWLQREAKRIKSEGKDEK